jgi:2-polyprenyl-3-methyl-5-hydroxy-6-metoxy-1,4-benzoquinol methylase
MTARKRTHTASTQAFFRSKAAFWSENYQPGGGMDDRVAVFASALASRLPGGAEILDFGCGSGAIARRLADDGWRITGCDITPEMIEAARAEDTSRRVRWEHIGTTTALPFAAGAFDAVLASSVLEYVDRPDDTISYLARVLRPGGLLIASVPDLRHVSRQRERQRQRILSIPGIAWLARRTRWAEGAHYLSISRNRFDFPYWIALFGQAGLVAEPVQPCRGPLAVLIARKK